MLAYAALAGATPKQTACDQFDNCFPPLDLGVIQPELTPPKWVLAASKKSTAIIASERCEETLQESSYLFPATTGIPVAADP